MKSSLSLVITLLVFFISFNQLFPQSSNKFYENNFEEIGRLKFGESTAVYVLDNLVLLGVSDELRVYDFTDFSNPQLISKVNLPGSIFQIELFDNNTTAFLSVGGYGIVVVDLSQIESLEIIRKLYFNDHEVLSFSIENEKLYVASNFQGFVIFDISDKSNINKIVRYDRTFNLFPGGSDIIVKDTIAYVFELYEDNGYKSRLRLLNVSNPLEVTEIAKYDPIDFGYSALDIEMKDALLYISSYNQGVFVIDVSDINNIHEISLYEEYGITDITMRDDLISAVTIDGFRIIDTSYPESLNAVAKFSRPWPYEKIVSSTFLTKNNIFMIDEDLTVFDYTNIDSLKRVGFLQTSGQADDIYVHDDYAFVLAKGSLQTYTISNKGFPNITNTLNFSGLNPLHIDGYGEIAYISGCNGFYMVDISVPSNLKILANYTTLSCVYDIEIKDNLVMLSTVDKIKIIDISDISNINEVSTIHLDNVRDVEIIDNFLFCGTEYGSKSGIYIYDIAAPETPLLVNTLPNAPGNFLESESDYLYAGGNDSNLEVFNIAQPEEPEFVTSLQILSGTVRDISIANDYLYVCLEAIALIDISNPNSPLYLDTWSAYSNGIFAKENYLYVADDRNGIFILKNNLITEVKKEGRNFLSYHLSQNYPNPFNPSTVIKYQIPNEKIQNVTLKVYDILGKEVVTLVNEEQFAGSYAVEFNAKDLSSGIYFYELLTPSFSQVRKMLLIK